MIAHRGLMMSDLCKFSTLKVGDYFTHKCEHYMKAHPVRDASGCVVNAFNLSDFYAAEIDPEELVSQVWATFSGEFQK